MNKAIDLLDERIALKQVALEECEREIADANRRAEFLRLEIETLNEFRAALTDQVGAESETLSTTEEINRLLKLRPMTADEIATALAKRIGQRGETDPKRIIKITLNQMVRRGKVKRDTNGRHQLK